MYGRRLQTDWQEDEETLRRLYRQEEDHQNRTRLQALRLLRQGRSMKEAAQIVGGPLSHDAGVGWLVPSRGSRGSVPPSSRRAWRQETQADPPAGGGTEGAGLPRCISHPMGCHQVAGQGSLPVQRRGCLPLLVRSRSGSALYPLKEAQLGPRALLLPHIHRVSPSAPCHKGFGPSSALR